MFETREGIVRGEAPLRAGVPYVGGWWGTAGLRGEQEKFSLPEPS